MDSFQIGSEMDSDGSDLLASPPSGILRRLAPRRAAAVGSLSVGLAALLAVCLITQSAFGEHRASAAVDLSSGTNLAQVAPATFLDSAFEAVNLLAEGLHSAAKMSDQVSESYNGIHQMIGKMNKSVHELEHLGSEVIEELAKPARLSKELNEKLHSLSATQKEEIRKELLKKLNITSLEDLKPDDNIHDGNRCADDEEEHAGLCYKKCSLLTRGGYPFRASAWECCGHQPPCLQHFKTEFEPCGGYGVSGDSTGHRCPHSPGGCLKDEELSGDLCYMRCSLLTSDMLQHRDGADSCCKISSPLALLEPGACDTDGKYGVGGGLGGGEGIGDASVPNAPHPPMTVLTEA